MPQSQPKQTNKLTDGRTEVEWKEEGREVGMKSAKEKKTAAKRVRQLDNLAAICWQTCRHTISHTSVPPFSPVAM